MAAFEKAARWLMRMRQMIVVMRNAELNQGTCTHIQQYGAVAGRSGREKQRSDYAERAASSSAVKGAERRQQAAGQSLNPRSEACWA